jgi:hypothetical protein
MKTTTEFPLWILHCGLPQHLAGQCKTPNAWLLFRTIVERDMADNRLPSTVEISLDELQRLTGLTPAQSEAAAKKLRKAGVIRCFLPDNEEESALFQVITPLQTPLPWTSVREQVPQLLDAPDHSFRYAHESPEAPPPDASSPEADPRVREVADLYLDLVSTRLNTFVLDELRLIAMRYDLALVRKVFARARQKEIHSLSWILKEVRSEIELEKKRKEQKAQSEQA